MSTFSKNQAYCTVAQFYQALDHSMQGKTVYEQILLEIDDVNLTVFNDTPWKTSYFHTQLRGSTLLHLACFQNHIKAFDCLLKRGADFTVKNYKGLTALHHVFLDCSPDYRCNDSWKKKIGILENAYVHSVLTAHVELKISENPINADGLSHFHIACAANNIEAVKLFVNSGVSVDHSVKVRSDLLRHDFSGYAPLHFAARFCGYETAKLLLEQGADLQAKDAEGLTPLNLVINRNFELKRISSSDRGHDKLDDYRTINENMIRLFLEHDSTRLCSNFYATCTLSDSSLATRLIQDVDVNKAINEPPKWQGWTPLHFAVQFNMEIAKMLLKNGANFNAQNASRHSALDFCISKGENFLYEILSSVPGIDGVHFSDNTTSLADFICAIKSLSTLEIFFQTTPQDVFLPKDSPLWPGYYLTYLAVIFSKSVNINECLSFENNSMMQDTHGRTPVHLAFYENKSNILDIFFKNQLEMTDAVDNDGLSLLHIACWYWPINERIITNLLASGADVNCAYKGKSLNLTTSKSFVFSKGVTPLHIAVALYRVPVAKVLLQQGADVNITDVNGMTPIHNVLMIGFFKEEKELGDLLFSFGNLRNIVSKIGLSHLHVASRIGNEDAAESLLKSGEDVNALIDSPSRNSGVPRYMLNNIIHYLGYAPLHCAVMHNHSRIIELILKNGADILHKKPNGITLFYEMLKELGKNVQATLGDIKTKRYFASLLANDEDLRKRMEVDTGITLLHVACAFHDVEQIKRLLIDGQVKVNAQVRSDSPIWPKATPLHVLIYLDSDGKNLKDPMTLLLDCGADITLSDDHDNTPLHSLMLRRDRSPRSYLVLPDVLRALIAYNKDFNFNPVNECGISHFQIACEANEYDIVEKFLKCGVDVNLPMEHDFETITFQTPLHIIFNSASFSLPEAESTLRTIDVLLKYGADVNAQDEWCRTPILKAAYWRNSRDLFFEKFLKAGADINCRNMRGQSILEVLFNSRKSLTNEELSFFLNNNVNFNIFNSISGTGIIANIHRLNNWKERQVLEKILGTPGFFRVEKIGRTPIHNIVAINTTFIKEESYLSYIEKFIKMGYDIDAQDSTGKTALHLAASFHNETALSSLLIVGADINLTDIKNKPAITQHFQVRSYGRFADGRVASPIKSNYALHIITFQLCDLEINSDNLELANSLPREENLKSHCKQVLNEIEMTKLVTIGSGSLTLRDFLSETGAVASRPSMVSEADRQAVKEFFESNEIQRFPKLKGLLRLQYRKMLVRLQLIKKATDSVKHLLGSFNGFPMPEICCRMIIRFLTNTEVKNLITSTSIILEN